MRDLFILDADKRPIPEPDLLAWATWSADHEHERQLAYTEIGDVKISTVYLGINSFPAFLDPDRPPILWETMVFNGAYDRQRYGYTSHAEALAGHATVEVLVGRAIAAGLVREASHDP